MDGTTNAFSSLSLSRSWPSINCDGRLTAKDHHGPSREGANPNPFFLWNNAIIKTETRTKFHMERKGKGKGGYGLLHFQYNKALFLQKFHILL